MGLYAENGAMIHKLVERKALVDTVRIKSADLEDKFLFLCFAAFRTA